MSDTSSYDPSKIPDQELREFAGSDATRSVSVLVELDSGIQVTWGESAEDGSGPRPRRVVAADQNDVRHRMERLTGDVKQIVHSDPVRLDFAEAVVADVTPPQLRAIAALPDVATIRPNRTHRAGGG